MYCLRGEINLKLLEIKTKIGDLFLDATSIRYPLIYQMKVAIKLFKTRASPKFHTHSASENDSFVYIIYHL